MNCKQDMYLLSGIFNTLKFSLVDKLCDGKTVLNANIFLVFQFSCNTPVVTFSDPDTVYLR